MAMKQSSPLGTGSLGGVAYTDEDNQEITRPKHVHGIPVPEEVSKANLSTSSADMLRAAGLLKKPDKQAHGVNRIQAEQPKFNPLESPDEINKVLALDVDKVDPSPFQPRKKFDEQALQELAFAIASNHGLNNPVVVRPRPNGRYELIAGERRLRAIRGILGQATIDAIVRDVDDAEAAILVAMDNNDEPLSDYENGQAYKRLIEDKLVESQAALARRMGVSPATISRCLAYLELPRPVLDMLNLNPDLVGTNIVRRFVALAKEGREDLVIEAVQQIADGKVIQDEAASWAESRAAEDAAKQAGKKSKPAPSKPVHEPLVFDGKSYGRSLLKGKRVEMLFEDADKAAEIYEAIKQFLMQRSAAKLAEAVDKEA
ncbi:ParB/RepB/Spo0J family partition protein [Azomonas macrocytogenes]|uniref:ParB family chromosome partitioning protein n=1 Tax=Azomonas macrocytogenes TaxID=69962 RepID=A0A839T713_AZOMA|nr:ParB/RepB/Spo0J family partition protein [Azomonas macrocytogenes]MBB3105271.1 ParB family chromosome partitioning protein [Azomonas macrocytogenes]